MGLTGLTGLTGLMVVVMYGLGVGGGAVPLDADLGFGDAVFVAGGDGGDEFGGFGWAEEFGGFGAEGFAGFGEHLPCGDGAVEAGEVGSSDGLGAQVGHGAIGEGLGEEVGGEDDGDGLGGAGGEVLAAFAVGIGQGVLVASQGCGLELGGDVAQGEFVGFDAAVELEAAIYEGGECGHDDGMDGSYE